MISERDNYQAYFMDTMHFKEWLGYHSHYMDEMENQQRCTLVMSVKCFIHLHGAWKEIHPGVQQKSAPDWVL